MENILIIGCGVVGSNMLKEFPNTDVHDPLKGLCRKPGKHYDVAFVCVPTPKNEDGTCNTSIVESVIKETENVDVFCIRSTIPPGTTDALKEKYKKRIVFSPEYYGETIHNLTVNFNFITLGGDDKDCHVVANVFIKKHSALFDIHYTDAKTAELAKYMENCYLGMMVSFCNEFANVAKAFGIDYHKVREAFLKDPRAPRSHTFVYDDSPGWKSVCLDKDIPAFNTFAKLMGVSTPVMTAVMQYKREK
jgi:UDPglucose 6-dehydrogenase